MKRIYEDLDLEIILFTSEDVITASTVDNEDDMELPGFNVEG